ncbi:hypothetical protein UFOVP221_109 [uncultured Caudovirales phage]|uniref:Uncharacterized protein n=1 Tax=uncultured Caudovirales phage TaxID=2100421 RepID=A0A6J7WX30_9CAUD|nr:hypothetical protein UFOVP221_109 [uncultured Caudovirales phage]
MAALDFPSSPTNGQVYGAYTYDSTKGAWNVTPQTQASVTTSDTAPVNPKSGDQWFYTVDGTMFVYYSDGTSSQWVEQPKSIAGGYSYYRSPNFLINGAFDIWQRGTTGTPTSSATRYVADRWETYRVSYAAGLTVSRQTATDAALLPNIQYCMRVQRTAANAGTVAIYAGQALETVNSIPLAGKTVTLSFYARAGANYSSGGNALVAQVQTGTGTDQNMTGLTGVATPISQNATLTTSWQKFSYTGTIATSATQVGVLFLYTPVGTAGAADYFEITGVMLEEGTAATSFRRHAPSIQAELAACQRYYVIHKGAGQAPVCWGMGFTSNLMSTGQKFPVPMRTTAPTVTIYSYAGTANKVSVVNNASDVGTTVTAGTTQMNDMGFFYVVDSGTGFSLNQHYWFWYTASAEL